MFNHFRAIGLLVGMSLLLCSLVYPLLLLGLGKILVPNQSEGSLVYYKGKSIGSRQIAQEFNQPQHFWSRPSAVGYHANGSGGSNLAASNPQFRDRVARDLARIYLLNDMNLGKQIELWVRQLPQPLLTWVKNNPILASNWVDDNKEPIAAWMKEHSKGESDFHVAFAKRHPDAWPRVVEEKQNDSITRRIIASHDGNDLQMAFFDQWIQEHPDHASVIPSHLRADAVTTSGSGLDPHITLKNAESQISRVVKAWQRLKPQLADQVEMIVRKGLQERAQTHLFGKEKLVNVLELNLFLEKEFNP